MKKGFLAILAILILSLIGFVVAEWPKPGERVRNEKTAIWIGEREVLRKFGIWTLLKAMPFHASVSWIDRKSVGYFLVWDVVGKLSKKPLGGNVEVLILEEDGSVVDAWLGK